MLTIVVRVTHPHNLIEVERQLGPNRRRNGVHWEADFFDDVKARETLLALRQLYGVQAFIPQDHAPSKAS